MSKLIGKKQAIKKAKEIIKEMFPMFEDDDIQIISCNNINEESIKELLFKQAKKNILKGSVIFPYQDILNYCAQNVCHFDYLINRGYKLNLITFQYYKPS